MIFEAFFLIINTRNDRRLVGTNMLKERLQSSQQTEGGRGRGREEGEGGAGEERGVRERGVRGRGRGERREGEKGEGRQKEVAERERGFQNGLGARQVTPSKNMRIKYWC